MDCQIALMERCRVIASSQALYQVRFAGSTAPAPSLNQLPSVTISAPPPSKLTQNPCHRLRIRYAPGMKRASGQRCSPYHFSPVASDRRGPALIHSETVLSRQHTGHAADSTQQRLIPASGPPQIEIVARPQLDDAVRRMGEHGFIQIGFAGFDGPPASREQLMQQALQVGAQAVTWTGEYARTAERLRPSLSFQPGQTYTTQEQGSITANTLAQATLDMVTAAIRVLTTRHPGHFRRNTLLTKFRFTPKAPFSGEN